MNSKDFPNNWQRIHDAPDEKFADDITWQDFEDSRLDSWDLMDSVCVVIRQEQRDNKGKIYRINEKSYQRPHAAEKFLAKAIDEDRGSVFLLCDNHQIGECTAIDVNQDYLSDDG